MPAPPCRGIQLRPDDPVSWEITGGHLGSSVLVLAAVTRASYFASILRYLGIQVPGLVLLLAGGGRMSTTIPAAWHRPLFSLSRAGRHAYFISSAIKAALPFMHNW